MRIHSAIRRAAAKREECRGMKAWLAVLAVTFGVPNLALACPACAGNSDGGMMRIAALGAMILFPFVITGFVIRAIRNTTPPDPPRNGGRAKRAADFSPPREGGARSERAERAENGGEP